MREHEYPKANVMRRTQKHLQLFEVQHKRVEEISQETLSLMDENELLRALYNSLHALLEIEEITLLSQRLLYLIKVVTRIRKLDGINEAFVSALTLDRCWSSLVPDLLTHYSKGPVEQKQIIGSIHLAIEDEMFYLHSKVYKSSLSLS